MEALDSDGLPLTELESGPEVVEKGQTEAPLTGRARNYSCINRLVALCGFFIFVIEVCHMFASLREVLNNSVVVSRHFLP